MVEQQYSLDDAPFIACNIIDEDLIILYLGEFHFRKNVSPKTLARAINRIFLEELVCLTYQQEVDEDVAKICNGLNKYCNVWRTVSLMY